LIARRELAVEHHLVERIAVDGELERLAHLGVLPERVLRLIGVGEIDGEARVGEARADSELQLRVAAHRGMSVASSRSMMSSAPERRLASRTVLSGIEK
jgi:hypothetical protein